jgi:ribosomal protein S4
MKQARQLVTHGQICIGDQKVTIPSYPVSRDEEEVIRYHPRSKLNDENHVIRQTIMGVRESAEYAEEEVDPEFTKDEAATVSESATEAPKAEDTVTEGGDQ